jgi:hypothetical protein
MYLTDPKNNKPSVYLTLLIAGFITALLKLLVSNSTIYGLQFGEFSGSDFSMVVGTVAALYFSRRYKSFTEKDK